MYRTAAFLAIASVLALFARWLVRLFIWLPITDPLSFIPGPRGSYFESHVRQVMDPEISPETYKEWRARYGQTFRFHGFGRHDLRLMSFDRRVVQTVLNSSFFEKPWQTRRFLGGLIGRGIFSTEGEVHAVQRKIVARAFSNYSVKQMSPFIYQKAEELVGKWSSIIESRAAPPLNHSATPRDPHAVIDVAHWLSRASFDVIGLAGFNYDFKAISDESPDVYCAYRRMFNIADKGLGLRQILELYFPLLRTILGGEDVRTMDESSQIIAQTSRELIANRKALLADKSIQQEASTQQDLLSLLIEANETSPEHLSDKELVDQCSTFFLAGSDSTAVAMSWCFYHLSLNPKIQMQLRNKLHLAFSRHKCDIGNGNESDSGFEDGSGCSAKCRHTVIDNNRYLDFVVRETLRLSPPIHGTIRVTTEDLDIPIIHPVTMSDGYLKDTPQENHICIRKGTYVHIPIEGLSHSEDIWGSDASEFNPDRWVGVKVYDPAKFGMHNLLAFGYGRSSCIGFKFSVAEMKAFIATMILRFEFCPAPDVKVSKFNTMVTRPYVLGKWEDGTQLPISIRKFHHDEYPQFYNEERLQF